MKTYKEFTEDYDLVHQTSKDLENLMADEYFGRNIVWHGYKGRMVKVDFDLSYPMWGNTFEEDKIEGLVDSIEQAEERYHLDAPLVSPSVITEADIIEYLRDEDGEHFSYDPLGVQLELTFGDDELDSYAKDPDEFLQDNTGYSLSEIKEYSEEDDDEDLASAVEMWREMETWLKEAIADKDGSIGIITFQVRDGNHRRVAAKRVGEPYFFGIVTTNDMRILGAELKDILL